jgi:hypothetical protein
MTHENLMKEKKRKTSERDKSQKISVLQSRQVSKFMFALGSKKALETIKTENRVILFAMLGERRGCCV